MDPDSRRAARIATLVAVPAALLTAVLLFVLLRGSGAPAPDDTGTPAPTGPVTMQARELPPRAATVCRALLAELPGTVRGLPQREVTAGAEQNAAYGEPPITLRCGVERVSLPATSTKTVYPLSGACWLPRKLSGGDTEWTTLDREVPVAITVPGGLSEPGQWVAAFSPYVADTPASEEAPSGCRK